MPTYDSLILFQKPHFGLNWVEIPLREVAADLFTSVQPMNPLQRVGTVSISVSDNEQTQSVMSVLSYEQALCLHPLGSQQFLINISLK